MFFPENRLGEKSSHSSHCLMEAAAGFPCAAKNMLRNSTIPARVSKFLKNDKKLILGPRISEMLGAFGIVLYT